MELSVWENVFLGAMVLGLIFWMRPSIKLSLQQSKGIPSDWLGALIPIAGVVLFVIFLITMV
jgi:TRAP-type C4-dicarboxylate transport system permease small subunit